ncbi:hypothetical protein DD829_18680 [Chryseobacterium sp. HMWF035]|nr:hypothetical protein DBR25_12555 [Chryseobacterium sp. HMWF001]PVV53534.1 hypothetical protein DD829_18680 [Chryseobacterium sp. HMWF035]
MIKNHNPVEVFLSLLSKSIFILYVKKIANLKGISPPGFQGGNFLKKLNFFYIGLSNTKFQGIAFTGNKTKVIICNVSSPLNLQDIQYIVFLLYTKSRYVMPAFV